MNIAEKLQAIAENEQKVYAAGESSGYAKGNTEGKTEGAKAEYDAFWDSFQAGGKRENYTRAFSGTGWTFAVLSRIKYPVTFRAEASTYEKLCVDMFSYLNWGGGAPIDMTSILNKFDFTNIKNASYLFSNAYVKNVTVKLPNATSINHIFNASDTGGRHADNINIYITEKCTALTNAFNYMTNLKNINFIAGSVISKSISFAQSPLLTTVSVDSIIRALMTITDGVARTVTFHANVKANLTDAQKAAITTTKGWTLA